MTGFTKSLKNKLLAVFIAVFALCAGAITVFAATGVTLEPEVKIIR